MPLCEEKEAYNFRFARVSRCRGTQDTFLAFFQERTDDKNEKKKKPANDAASDVHTPTVVRPPLRAYYSGEDQHGKRENEPISLALYPHTTPHANNRTNEANMNAFFWSRRKPMMDLVRSVDGLLAQLLPDDKLGHAFDALSISVDDRALDINRKRGGSNGTIANGNCDEVDVIMKAHDAELSMFEMRKRGRTDSGDPCELDDDALPHLQEEENSDEQSDDEPCEKTVPEELERQWAKIRSVFHGWDEEQGDREKKMDRMAELLLRYRVLEKALYPKVMALLTFETRKYVGSVFRAMTVHNLRGFNEFVAKRSEIMGWLAEGYRNNDTALICGTMLRDCFVHEMLTVTFLRDMEAEFAYLFKVTLTNSNFDISADAFMNITRLLMGHKEVTVHCLNASFDRIFGLLNSLLSSQNYVTKRQALQLLAELLLNPVNFAVMQRYIASRDNLKLVMLLLREPSQALRMDAFHVFKIFVANPHKSTEVEQVLLRNREKLLAFVCDFGKQELDRDFHQEKSLLVFTLQRMAEKERNSAPVGVVSRAPTAASNGVALASNVSESVCASGVGKDLQ